jgi:hypothetical protein
VALTPRLAPTRDEARRLLLGARETGLGMARLAGVQPPWRYDRAARRAGIAPTLTVARPRWLGQVARATGWPYGAAVAALAFSFAVGAAGVVTAWSR